MTSYSLIQRKRQMLIEQLVEFSGGLDAVFVDKIIMYAECQFMPDSEDISETTFISEMANQFDMTNSFMISLILNAVRSRKYQTGIVTLDQFCKVICVFLTQNIDVKINFVFLVYDLDHNGSLSRTEVYSMLKSSVPQGEDEQEEVLKELIEIVLKLVDRDGNGSIDLEEFRSRVKRDILFIEILGQCLPDDKAALRFKNKLEKRTALEIKQYFEFEKANTLLGTLLPSKKNGYYPIDLDLSINDV